MLNEYEVYTGCHKNVAGALCLVPVLLMFLQSCTKSPASVQSDTEFARVPIEEILKDDFVGADTFFVDSGEGELPSRFYRAQTDSCVFGFTFFLVDTVADAYYSGYLISVTVGGEILGTMPLMNTSKATASVRDTVSVSADSRCGELFNGLSIWHALYVASNEPCGTASVVQDTSHEARYAGEPDRHTRTPARIAWLIQKNLPDYLSGLYRSRQIRSCTGDLTN